MTDQGEQETRNETPQQLQLTLADALAVVLRRALPDVRGIGGLRRLSGGANQFPDRKMRVSHNRVLNNIAYANGRGAICLPLEKPQRLLVLPYRAMGCLV